MNRTIKAFLATMALLWPSIHYSGQNPETDDTIEKAFQTAIEHMQNRRPKEAIPYLDQVRKEYPNDPTVLWNLGLVLVDSGEHVRAAEIWLEYRKVAPEDWRGMAKVIQAYQALGQLDSRNREIDALRKFWEQSTDTETKKAKRFCREQGLMAGQSVFVFEYFSPEDPRQVFYRFSVVDIQGKESFHLSLGSYELTTNIARELGEIPKDKRMYHLDEYRAGQHTTYGFFREKPDYDQVRRLVIDVLNGKRKPVSGFAAPRVITVP